MQSFRNIIVRVPNNVVFFINIAPNHDHEWDRKEFIGPIRPHFYDGIHNEMNNWFMKIMGKGTPVLIVTMLFGVTRFLRFRAQGITPLELQIWLKRTFCSNFFLTMSLKWIKLNRSPNEN